MGGAASTRRIGELLLELVPIAVICALSPWAVVAVILMLASKRPSNAVWWMTGWTLSTVITGAFVYLVIGSVDESGQRAHSMTACVVQLVLGGLLLAVALRVWSRRPARTGVPPTEPGWMQRIDAMRPIVAFGLGAFWINSALVIAAAVDTLRADLSTATSLAVCVLFSVASAVAQAAIILYARLRPGPAKARLQGIQAWIMQNQQGVIACRSRSRTSSSRATSASRSASCSACR